MLYLHSFIVRKGAFRSRFAPFPTQTKVLVVAHGIFRETVEDAGLLVAKPLHPSLHVIHHFVLDFRIFVVEIWVEEALKNILGQLAYVHRVVIPGFGDQSHSVDDDNFGKVTGWFVEDEIEMILGQE